MENFTTTSTSPSSSCIELLEDNSRSWWLNLAVCGIIYLSSVSFSLFYVGTKVLVRKMTRNYESIKDNATCLVRIHEVFRDFFKQLLLGDSIFSKVVISVNLLCNIIFLCLAVHRSTVPVDAEIVFSLQQKPQFIIELLVNTELVLFSGARFFASSNKVLYWLSPYTIVDVLTLPHIIVSIALGMDWIGLRSLRFIWLLEIITVMHLLPFIGRTVTDAVSLLMYVIVLWLMSAGIIHLLESQGDPWNNFKNAQCETFFIYAYMIMVTLSTVGYGDISPKTTLGRIFITFFIVVGLGLFAAMLPRLADITTAYYQSTQFTTFNTSRVSRHAIVCGHITNTTAKEFLKDFLHPDRGDKKTHILFLNVGKPDIKLRDVIRSYDTRVHYLDGSVLSSKDLRTAKIKSACAVFILANKNASDPSEEDSSNLFRLVSVKNTATEVPIIIQLLHSFSKNQVFNIDGWNKCQDVAICLNELKLGLLAQSCLCPGFSTLIANLFYTTDTTMHSNRPPDEPRNWFDLYINGASNEIYTSYFSEYFWGKDYHQVSQFCFRNFKLMLVAIEKGGKVYVNPSATNYPSITIGENTSGYFVAQNREQVWVVEFYCPQRHSSSFRLTRREDAHATSLEEDNIVTVTSAHFYAQTYQKRLFGGKIAKQRSANRIRASIDVSKLAQFSETSERFHIYVSEPNKLAAAILNPEMAYLDATVTQLDISINDHIVVCLFSNSESPLMGLHGFLNPLRNRLLPSGTIKPVVIVSNKAFIEKEWTIIRNIPNVYAVVGSPLRWPNLESAQISKASVCVILTAPSGSSSKEDGIHDKEPILCTLSLKNAKKLKKCSNDMKLITDLIHDSNIQFLDIGDEDKPDERICETQLFACGEAFSATMFDSLTCSAFHTPGILQVVERLIYPSGKSSLLKSVSIADTGFAGKKFVEFYEFQIAEKNMCLGLFRKLHESTHSRFVVTSPDPQLILKESDSAFVITE